MLRTRPFLLLTGLSVALCLVAGGRFVAQDQDHVGQYSQADINYGMRLYGETCIGCHGDGDAVPGVNLRSGQFRSASSDQELMFLIRSGIPDTAMPPGDYNQAELTGLVAYLRTMGDFDLSDVTVGDADRGRGLYAGKGDCARCHRVGGEGSHVAPDLSDIGAVRTAGSLAASLVDPTEAMLPINRPVRAVTRDGTLHTGRRLNEDTYTVQLIDQNQRLVSLVKDDLQEYAVLTTSSMPSYEDTMNEQERADVLAYLLTLKGMN